MKTENFKPKGFSLVELIVAVAITSLIMVGISAFFSTGFQNMFQAREAIAGTLDQLTFSNVIQRQFIKAEALHELSDQGVSLILQNDPRKTPFNFSYLGENDGQIMVKDFFVFNDYDGNKASQDFAESVENPAGIAQLQGYYYVAAPLENAIYQCSESCKQKLPLEGLKYPMGLATDGTNLFVTDAGNDRVIKIENVGASNDITVMATGFNFPTGIEYYSGGKGYLFVSDTNNHQVKKIQIEGDSITTVVGNGTNVNCDNSAEYCQLSYPMGLAIGNDGSGEALYIADTGHGRILKVTKPEPLTAFDLNFTSPETPEAFKEIKFVFPQGTKLDSAIIDSISTDNGSLTDKGSENRSDNIFTYGLWTQLVSNTQNTNSCTKPPCLIFNNKIEVLNHDLFDTASFNQLQLGDDLNNPFSVSSKQGSILTLSQQFATHHNPNTEVVLTSPVQPNTQINFKFSNVDATSVQGGFKPVTIQMYNEAGKFLASQKIFFRFRGEELGTPDDIVSVFADHLAYPTGISWSGNTPVYSEIPAYPKAFTHFDYRTNFVVSDFHLETKNQGSLLEMRYKTLKNPDQKEKVYENHVLNFDLKP